MLIWHNASFLRHKNKNLFSYFCHARPYLCQKTQPSCQRAALQRPHPQKQSVCHISASSPENVETYNSLQSERSGVWLVSFIFLVGYRITGLWWNPSLWFTWNEWTGSCLTLFLTFTLEGVGSGTAVFGWAARLWLVTASCNAFKTFKQARNLKHLALIFSQKQDLFCPFCSITNQQSYKFLEISRATDSNVEQKIET